MVGSPLKILRVKLTFAAEPAKLPSEKKHSTWKTLLSIICAPTKDTMIAPNTIMRRIDSSTTLTMRFLPNTATTTTVECCVYTKGNPESVDEGLIQSIQTEIQAEIESMEMQQRKLRLGDVPSPNHETEQFEKLLAIHREKEQVAGHEINPAAQKKSRSSAGTEDDDCKLPSNGFGILKLISSPTNMLKSVENWRRRRQCVRRMLMDCWIGKV